MLDEGSKADSLGGVGRLDNVDHVGDLDVANYLQRQGHAISALV
jgi:hypothetical protein